MNTKFKLALVAVTMTGFAAFANDNSKALPNGYKEVVKNSFGECVIVTTNTNNVGCGAAAAVAPKKEPQQAEVDFSFGANALFNTAKSFLRPAGQAELKELAAKITNAEGMPKLKSISEVDVVGHADNRGSAKYNQKLSERRAESVRKYLVSQGVPAGIITASGEGEMNPVASNASAKGRQQNRRVDVSVKGTAVEK